MNKPPEIPDDVRAKQIAASEPDVSAWVAANAGSGKTYVLAQKVIRLLLAGVEPARILCITFTKAAAANMANQVFNRLRSWTALDDAALDAEMKTIGVPGIDADQRARARKLFALALETPGGLKVQTIHAFCTQLLHLFPFEAKVAARFSVLDEAAETQLLEKINLEVLLDAAEKPDTPLGRALAVAIAAAADQTFREVLNEAIGERDRLTAWIDAAGSVDAAIAQLSKTLGIASDDTLERVEKEIVQGPNLPMTDWASVAALCAASSVTDQRQCARLKVAAAASGEERIDAYLSVFFSEKNEPRKSIVTGPLARNHPDLARRFTAEQARAVQLRERRYAIAVRERTRALVTVADELLGRFRAEKDRRGLLDYDDLIDKALDLLTNTSAAWVHYKLDRGINHVLIDEAQDTSPKQWAIVRALVAEFFAGEGAQSIRRTIFAVGDEKQSIFSFQGAAPREFEIMRREFDALSKAAKRALHYVRLGHSFRSGANVLAAIDTVFERADIYTSVTSDEDGIPPHVALPHAAPGLVEIWDTEKPAERREILGWDAPFDTQTETSPAVRLADRIARSVQAWQRQGTRPGDVLILVRRRGPLFEAIIRALKDAAIAVAGADRLVLTEHIAVMDLIALADALLLPDDELALATVLKSPLFGFDDEQLFRLAWNRKVPLRAALSAKAEAPFAEAAARLEQFSRWAKDESPFGFFARLLNSFGGRRRFLARLGLEAADALDEFLNLALVYERSETPSLQGFVAWLRAAKSEVKRDMDIARDEVRVMTVHGAKGLEARTVILADTTTPPEGFHPPRLLMVPTEQAAPGAPDCLVWAFAATLDVGPMSVARVLARSAARDEYRRLLYVAMTRAIDRLIICGTDGERKRPEGCWYDLVHDALKPDAVEEPADDGSGIVWRYRKTPVESVVPAKAQDSEPQPIALPQWIKRDAPKEAPRPIWIYPSRAFDELETPPQDTTHAAIHPLQAETDNGKKLAGGENADLRNRPMGLLRGNLVHRLMQSLPDIAPNRRADAAHRYLARAGRKFTEAERETIARQVMAILDDPRFADLFAPGSRAELSIAGRVGDNLVTGQVDRLTVTPEAVLIADYKSNHMAPRSVAEALDCHAGYITQLALYRAVLMRLYPERPVRAALVWTDVPQLMEIPAESLDSALMKNTPP